MWLQDERAEYSLGPFDERTEKLLERFKETLEKEWGRRISRKPPEVLWHYTDAEGFRAIISNGTFRFSHARLLNDPTEIAYGWTQISQALDREIARRDRLANVFEMTRSVAGEVLEKYHYFVFSLSARPDSLSQWRAYGSGGAGYALGFDAGKLAHERSDGEFVFLQLAYSPEERTAVISAGTSACREFFEELGVDVPSGNRAGILHRANVLLAHYLMRCSLLFKGPSFEDEAEWRLVVGYSYGAVEERDREMLKKVQFRTGAGLVRPFIDFDFRTEVSNNLRQLPLRRVMYGPTLRPTATKFSLEFFLGQNGYGAIAPEKSAVPLEA